jgi:hypothetical protein
MKNGWGEQEQKKPSSDEEQHMRVGRDGHDRAGRERRRDQHEEGDLWLRPEGSARAVVFIGAVSECAHAARVVVVCDQSESVDGVRAGAAERWQWHGRAEQADPGDSGSVGEIFQKREPASGGRQWIVES